MRGVGTGGGVRRPGRTGRPRRSSRRRRSAHCPSRTWRRRPPFRQGTAGEKWWAAVAYTKAYSPISRTRTYSSLRWAIHLPPGPWTTVGRPASRVRIVPSVVPGTAPKPGAVPCTGCRRSPARAPRDGPRDLHGRAVVNHGQPHASPRTPRRHLRDGVLPAEPAEQPGDECGGGLFDALGASDASRAARLGREALYDCTTPTRRLCRQRTGNGCGRRWNDTGPAREAGPDRGSGGVRSARRRPCNRPNRGRPS